MNATTLLGWLRAKPALASVRCDGDPGKVVRIVARKYKTAEDTIVGLDPERLEGLDADGAIVRTWTMREAAAPTTAPAAPPEPPVVWPEGNDLSTLGQVLSIAIDKANARLEAAYEKNYERVAEAYKYNFEVLKGMHETAAGRLENLENRVFDMLELRVKEAEAVAEDAMNEAEELREATAAQEPSTADGLAAQVLGIAASKVLGTGEDGKG